MFVFQCCTSLTSTKILRQVRPYRHILGMLAGGLLLLTAVLRLTNLKGDLLDQMQDAERRSIGDVDLDSSLHKDKVDIKIVRRPNPKKKKDIMKHGGFAPWKKLKLTTDEPAVEIPPFFPKVEYNCRTNIKRVAGAWIHQLKDPGDAQHRHRTDSWNLCFDTTLTRLNAFAPRGSGKTNCVVYSFGMDQNWSFEEDMLLHNCEVHMFDGGDEHVSRTLRRKVKNLTFHRAILSHKNIKRFSFIEDKQKSEKALPADHKTLSTIMEELEHKRVDVLKLDIDGGELEALEEGSAALTAGVDQLLLEIHMHLSDHAHDSARPEHFEQATIDKWSKLFASLRADGYRLYDIRAKGTDRDGNIIPQHHYSCCYRLSLIKTPYKAKQPDNKVSFDDLELNL